MEGIHESAKYISLLYRFVITKLAKDIKNIGLTIGQSILLIGIMRNPGKNQDTLAKIIFVDTATTSRNMKFLEENGYIKRNVDPENRRSFLVFPTEKGILKANESLDIQNELWDKIFADISEDDAEKLSEILEKGDRQVKENLI